MRRRYHGGVVALRDCCCISERNASFIQNFLKHSPKWNIFTIPPSTTLLPARIHFDAVTANVLKIDELASMPSEPIGPRWRWQRRGTGERFSRSRRAGRTRSVFAAEDAVRVATSDFALRRDCTNPRPPNTAGPFSSSGTSLENQRERDRELFHCGGCCCSTRVRCRIVSRIRGRC